MNVLPPCLYGHWLYCSTFQKSGWDALEMELASVVSHHVSAGKRTQILCKSSKCLATEPSLIFPAHPFFTSLKWEHVWDQWVGSMLDTDFMTWVRFLQHTWWNERTNFCKLSSDLHTYTVAHTHLHLCTQITYTFKINVTKLSEEEMCTKTRHTILCRSRQ